MRITFLELLRTTNLDGQVQQFGSRERPGAVQRRAPASRIPDDASGPGSRSLLRCRASARIAAFPVLPDRISIVSGIDLVGTQAALLAATSRTSALLRTVTDPATAVPNLSWTVAETAAHLVTGLHHYTEIITGEVDVWKYLALAPDDATPGERGVIANVRLLEEFTERDLARLAGMVVAAAEGFVAVSDRRPPDEPMLAFNGLPMTVPVMTAAMLGEQLIHGLDIARAVGVDWPISRTKALQVIAGVMAMVPDYVDRQKAAGLHAAYELRFRGGPRYRLTIDDGTAAVGPATRQADCWISADPVAYLLVGYGRNAQWGALLRGKIIAGGRKPWLGLKFGRLLTGA